MENIFGGVGVMSLYSKVFFYASGLSYITFAALSIYARFILDPLTLSDFSSNQTLCLNYAQQLRAFSLWLAIVNIIAFVAGTMFYYGQKGETTSITGMLTFLLNIFSMITLFIWS